MKRSMKAWGLAADIFFCSGFLLHENNNLLKISLLRIPKLPIYLVINEDFFRV